MSVKSSRVSFNYLMLVSGMCSNSLDMYVYVWHCFVSVCRIWYEVEAVGSLVALHSWPHFHPNEVPFMFCSCAGSNLLFVCVFVIGWMSFVLTSIWKGSMNKWMENPHSLTSSGLRDSLIQTQFLTPSQSAGPLSTSGEETQIWETVSKMNHPAKTLLVKVKNWEVWKTKEDVL